MTSTSTCTAQPWLKSNHLLLIHSASTGPKERLNITSWKLHLTGLCCKTFGEFGIEMFCDSIKALNHKVFIETTFSICTKLDAENWPNMEARTEHEKPQRLSCLFIKLTVIKIKAMELFKLVLKESCIWLAKRKKAQKVKECFYSAFTVLNSKHN